MIYGYLSFSLDYDTDFLRQYALFMFWYTVAINTIYGTKSSVLVVIICSIGIVSGISMITDTERPLVSYMFGGRRIHAEGEGLEMNINNISLALIAIVACASVLEKKFGITRFSKILIPSLFLVTGIVLMIGQTRSALLFFFLLIIYRFFSFSLRSAFLLGLISVITCFYIILYFDQFLLIFDQFLLIFRFSDYDYGNSQRLVAILNSLEAFSYSPLNGMGDGKLLKMQMLENGATDHNFYTKLLGSHGLIGLTFVMFFFYGIIKRSTKNTQGLIILQLFFLYSFVFAPSGPGCILIATIIFYINEYDRTEKFKQLPIRYH